MTYPRTLSPGETPTIRCPARVLFLHPSNELYGSDVVLLNLLRGLDRRRVEPLVVLANDLDYEGLLSKELEASGIACRQLPIAVMRRKYFSPRGIPAFYQRLRQSTRDIAALIEREHIDIVHTNTLAVWTGATAARRTGRPHLWHIHELLERPPQLNSFMRRFVPSHTQRVISVSQAGLDHLLLPEVAREKGVVLYNGLKGEDWAQATGRERIRRELGCRPDDVVLGMVARISSFKAPDTFVEAAALLLRQHANVVCFIAGGPVPGQTAMLDRLRQLIAASPAPDRIRLLGFRRDTPDLLAGLDILVQPSRDPEACSMTILQAMFAGKPVAATDVGGNKELVVDGATGILVPKEQPEALASALDALIRDPLRRQNMGTAGQQRAYRQFTLEEQVRRFNQILWETYVASARR